ncbi:hypothetical protein F4774DRAFT_50381 [Daldinia eschscholtzii]|nr:hypothetical protein F4774DRAFT_50381 [Daldinia eschscholtzii]
MVPAPLMGRLWGVAAFTMAHTKAAFPPELAYEPTGSNSHRWINDVSQNYVWLDRDLYVHNMRVCCASPPAVLLTTANYPRSVRGWGFVLSSIGAKLWILTHNTTGNTLMPLMAVVYSQLMPGSDSKDFPSFWKLALRISIRS